MFGVCYVHEARAIGRHFARLVSGGFADHLAPPCFESQFQWQEYTVAFVLSRGYAMTIGEKTKIDYCRDCTVKFKKQMMDCGKCHHPETVFIVQDSSKDVVGVSIQDDKKSGYWEKSMMGVEGTVVHMPPSSVIDEVLNRLARRKLGGRPKSEVAK